MTQEWINVKDRLPEDDNCVLTYDENGSTSIGYFDPSAIDLGWQDYEGYHQPITHWMPLPEPPKS